MDLFYNEINYTNLKNNLYYNPTSIDYVKVYNLTSYANKGLLAAGVATVISGILLASKNGNGPEVELTFFAGTFLGIVSSIISHAHDNSLKNALRSYNE